MLKKGCPYWRSDILSAGYPRCMKPAKISDEDVKAMSDAVDRMEKEGITSFDPAFNVMFILKINLGNDAMLTNKDLAKVLRDQSDKIKCQDIVSQAKRYGAQEGTIRDRNGNTVGSWQVK